MVEREQQGGRWKQLKKGLTERVWGGAARGVGVGGGSRAKIVEIEVKVLPLGRILNEMSFENKTVVCADQYRRREGESIHFRIKTKAHME